MLGFVPDEDLPLAYRAANFSIVPTVALEGFGLITIESLAAGTPVVANGHSDVVSWHIDRSGAGLTYCSQAELVACLDFVTDEPEAASNLARDGRDYVIEHYGLDTVVDAVVETVEAWMPPAVTERRGDVVPIVAGGGRS